MDNFDLKKYLVENRLTKSDQLNEAKTTGQISNEIEELDDIKRRYEEKGDFNRAAKIEDKIENLKSEFTNRINEMGTPEQEKIKKSAVDLLFDKIKNVKVIDSYEFDKLKEEYRKSKEKEIENIKNAFNYGQTDPGMEADEYLDFINFK